MLDNLIKDLSCQVFNFVLHYWPLFFHHILHKLGIFIVKTVIFFDLILKSRKIAVKLITQVANITLKLLHFCHLRALIPHDNLCLFFDLRLK